MELYSGTPSGTHNIAWGNYDWYYVMISANDVASHSAYFTKEEFMICVYNTGLAVSGTRQGNYWSTLRLSISTTNTYQLTFTMPYFVGNDYMLLKGIKKI